MPLGLLRVSKFKKLSLCHFTFPIPWRFTWLVSRLLVASESYKLKVGNTEEELVLNRKRNALDLRITKHHQEAEKFIPAAAADALPEQFDHGGDDEWEDDEDPDLNADEPPKDPERFTFSSLLKLHQATPPEKKSIFLPSTLGHHACNELKLHSLVEKELALRQGQANDALHAIRIAIGEKSFRFRKQLRNATSKIQKTRSWDSIHTASGRLKQARNIYRQARQAMVNLKLSPEILETYKPLTPKDTCTNTAVQEPNARGQRNKELSWIWKMPGLNLGETSFLMECEHFPCESFPVLFLQCPFFPHQYSG